MMISRETSCGNASVCGTILNRSLLLAPNSLVGLSRLTIWLVGEVTTIRRPRSRQSCSYTFPVPQRERGVSEQH